MMKRAKKQTPARRVSREDFIRLSEFPVNPEMEERILELTRLAREGDISDMDEMFFDMWLEDERRNAFPADDRLAAPPGKKQSDQRGRHGD